MNLYLISFSNENNVGYNYFVYADSMKFNGVGNGAEFILNGEVIRIVQLYNSIIKLDIEQFDLRFKKDKFMYLERGCDESSWKDEFIKNTNIAPERFNYM